MSLLAQAWGKLGPGLDTPARAGLLSASISVAPSMQRGLMPRSTLHQAAITGVVTAANFGITTTLQSLVQSVAFGLAGVGHDQESRRRRRGLQLAANAVAAGVGLAVERALPEQRNEPVRRAMARTGGRKLFETAACGLVIVSGLDALSRVDSSRDDDVFEKIPIAIPLGAAVATALIWRQRRALAEAGDEDAYGQTVEADSNVSVRKAVLAGTGIMLGLTALAQAERAFAAGIAAATTTVAPPLAPYGRLLGHAAGLGLLAYGANKGLGMVYQRFEQGGQAIEAAYATPPESAFVSGGTNSLVDWTTIGREGRRFVNMALSGPEIAKAVGEDSLDPIRAFVGLGTIGDESARNADEASDLAIRELERLGALERSVLCLFSPTGTGYVNYVAVETLEYLSRGDCASVALQYSIRPSYLSLGRTELGEAQIRTFLNALRWRLATIPEDQRPRVVMFGESLGAWTGQDAFFGQGTKGYDRLGVDRALFIGTPWESRWYRSWDADPDQVDPDHRIVQVSNPAGWDELSEAARDRARVVLLTNDNDPIAKFTPQLIVQRPSWLGPPETRPPGVPRETYWRPFATFMITVMDVINALDPIPGQFVATGHDYRKSLAAMTQQAFRLPASAEQMVAVEAALRERELAFAQRRLIDETMAKSEGKIRDQLGKWGVDTAKAPPLVAVPTS
jgi:uncharacterized membrane protein